MLFILKKVIGSLMMPLSISLIFSLIGLILLWFTKRTRLAGIFLSIGFFILLIFSAYLPSHWLNKFLEKKHAPLIHVSGVVNTVVVLGGGIIERQDLPENQQLTGASLIRLIEGIRLFDLIKAKGIQPTLIVSGGASIPNHITSGNAMYKTALLLGVPKKNIVLENHSRDTHEEALFLKDPLKNQPFYLVTSAIHMPRAMSLFEHEGLHPIAAPTDFTETIAPMYYYFLPDDSNLSRSQSAVHEYLGQAWEAICEKLN